MFLPRKPVAMKAHSSRTAALAEITAMLALLLSYIWGWQGTFPGDEVLVVLLYFAVGYVSHVRCRESARVLGLRLDNWRSAARQACVPNVFVLGIAHAAISMVLYSALPVSMTHDLRVGPGYYTVLEEPPHAP